MFVWSEVCNTFDEDFAKTNNWERNSIIISMIENRIRSEFDFINNNWY